MRKISLFLLFVLCGIAFALTTSDVENIIKQIERELKNTNGEQKYYFHIEDRSRTWEGQAYEMRNMYRNSYDTAKRMYAFSEEMWDALENYGNYRISDSSFIDVLKKYRSRFKHVGGNAVDISLRKSKRIDINRMEINKGEELEEIKRELEKKGLSYFDESEIECLHVYQ